MLSVADTLRAVLARVPRLATQEVSLDEALGRVLAVEIIAARALPGFDHSAMDGYAARSAELPATLPRAGVVAAGEWRGEPVPSSCCVRIFTGAPIPPGLDTVVIQEDVTLDGERVALPASNPGDNIRRRGEDVAIGDHVLAAGTRLGPWDLGVLAALGVSRVTVSRPPRVGLIATGDELVAVAVEPGPGQLVDSSGHALAALVREAGGIAHHLGIARDDPGSLAALIASALAYDAVITTGGVSVGDRDHVHAALATAGVTLELWKVAMKPGKPFSFGLGKAPAPGAAATPVFGLPGNPVSTVVAFELFLRPALLAMQGAAVTERPRAPVQLAGGYRKQAGRAHYLRARVERRGEQLIAHPHAKQGSAMLSSLVGCNALVELPAELTELAPGGTAPAILFEAV
ncbi:MAG: molybdenum cofactor synthesis domain protein [Deltaproteobacteria bacterium]|nr:molybdenum cofactor synthesis domain protein [Deltaproteobacteria bacterium]